MGRRPQAHAMRAARVRIEVFLKPCPPHLHQRFDEALGHAHRIRILNNMVDDWLVTVAKL